MVHVMTQNMESRCPRFAIPGLLAALVGLKLNKNKFLIILKPFREIIVLNCFEGF